MLSITDTVPSKSCAGFSRREFIRIGGAGMGSLTLPSLLSARGQPGFVRDRSVVLLFLQGGPSHIEFFDPKMSAPPEIRSITGEIQTKTPSITFGSTFPRLAAMTDKFTVVRSYQSKNSGHTYQDVVSARNPFRATIRTRVTTESDPFSIAKARHNSARMVFNTSSRTEVMPTSFLDLFSTPHPMLNSIQDTLFQMVPLHRTQKSRLSSSPSQTSFDNEKYNNRFLSIRNN